ncbi:MAG: SCO family protein [Thiomonas sp.]
MDYIGPKVMQPVRFSDIASSSGKTESSKEFLGKVVVLYFGYTHCPDVCPTTMAHLARAQQLLGAQGRDVQVIFVTVDPKRDTPKVLDAYVHAFMSDAIGLSGTVAQTKALADRYHVSYSYGKPDAHGNYVVNHSAAIYVFGPRGNGRLIGTELTPPAGIAHDVRQLLADAHRSWWQKLV